MKKFLIVTWLALPKAVVTFLMWTFYIITTGVLVEYFNHTFGQALLVTFFGMLMGHVSEYMTDKKLYENDLNEFKSYMGKFPKLK